MAVEANIKAAGDYGYLYTDQILEFGGTLPEDYFGEPTPVQTGFAIGAGALVGYVLGYAFGAPALGSVAGGAFGFANRGMFASESPPIPKGRPFDTSRANLPPDVREALGL